ncbi:MAG: MarR family transcriptional regulator [Ruthenibacterium sp.]
MDRVSLTAQLLRHKHRTTLAHEQYLSTLREYFPGNRLYMREVHFVMAASPTKPVSIAEIAEKLEVTAGAVSQLAARLEKKDYIVRERAAADRRQMLVSLTDTGKALYAQHEAFDYACLEKISRLLEPFSEEELEKFMRYEDICRQAFSEKDFKQPF